MSFPDFQQTVEDHSCLLIIVNQIGAGLKPKIFNKIYDRIAKVRSIRVGNPVRVIQIRYRKEYPSECNIWGDYQYHRKALGLICVGKCEADSSETDEPKKAEEEVIKKLKEEYKALKELHEYTLLDSRLLILNGAATQHAAISKQQSEPKNVLDAAEISSNSGVNSKTQPAITDPLNASVVLTSSHSEANKEKEKQSLQLNDTLRRIHSETGIAQQHLKDENFESLGRLPRKGEKNGFSKSNGTRENNSDVWTFSGEENLNSEDFDRCLYDYLSSIFWVLESKRMDRSQERSEHPTLLSSPIERKETSTSDFDSRVFRRKCQGRLRKQLGDLCLLAGVPLEAILNYQAALEILRPINDNLWIAGALEGTAIANVIVLQSDSFSTSSTMSLQRNISFSTKRGVGGAMKNFGNSNVRAMNGSVNHATGLDLAETSGTSHSAASASQPLPDSIVTDFKDAIVQYGRVKDAGVIELEASLKACRVLIKYGRSMEAAEYLQNIVYITIPMAEGENMERFLTLGGLYSELGMRRKSAFCYRIAAMQCVLPSNTNVSWSQCYRHLLKALPGYQLHLDTKHIPEEGPPGWTSIQLRVLHELVYASRRISNPTIAVRHLAYLLHVMFNHLRDSERLDLTSLLKTNAGKADVSTSHSIALDNGTILPPVPLTRFPTVQSFRIVPLLPHYRPIKMKEERSEVATESTVMNPFIYSPLMLGGGNNAEPEACIWVAGDSCEVQLNVTNPLLFELEVTSFSLTSDGVRLGGDPMSLSIPPDSHPVPVKVCVTPRNSGQLTFSGYVSDTLGVRSQCRFKDLPSLSSATVSQVQVVSSLPLLQVSSSLSSSETFSTLAHNEFVVSSGSVTVRAGQTSTFTLSLSNVGNLQVEKIDFTLSSSLLSTEDIPELLSWNHATLQNSLPLRPSETTLVEFTVTGLSDFLSKSAVTHLAGRSEREVVREGGWRRRLREFTDPTGASSVELLVLIRYSGGTSQLEGYSRQCAFSLFVDIVPAVQITGSSLVGSCGASTFQLCLDLINVSRYEMEVSDLTREGDKENSLLGLDASKKGRIVLTIPRYCKDDGVTLDSTPKLQGGVNKCEPSPCTATDKQNKLRAVLLNHIVSNVRLRWSIPSRSLSGHIFLGGLYLTDTDCDIVESSRVTWEIKINDNLISTSDSLSIPEQEPVRIRIVFQSLYENVLSNVRLSLEITSDGSESTIGHSSAGSFITVGPCSASVDKLSQGKELVYETCVLFAHAGQYRLLCKVVGNVTDAANSTAVSETWRHVVRLNICETEQSIFV